MISNAISIALLVTAGFVLLFNKLPRNVRKFITKYSLVTDFFCMISTYYMFGGTVTAIMAGAIVDVMVSALLHIVNHPDDFKWIFDTIEMIKDLVAQAKGMFKDFSKTSSTSAPVVTED